MGKSKSNIPAYGEEETRKAKACILELYGRNQSRNAIELFNEKDLGAVEAGIRNLNELSSKAWLVSSIALYSLVYDRMMYMQSGLSWTDYMKQARARLGMDSRDVSERLSSARFFIRHHDELMEHGYSIKSCSRILARAELALELSGDLDATISHVCSDTWVEFHAWYTDIKDRLKGLKDCRVREDSYTYRTGVLEMNGKPAITVAEGLDRRARLRMYAYVRDIAEALRNGEEPAVISVRDRTEANRLVMLRNEYRRKG